MDFDIWHGIYMLFFVESACNGFPRHIHRIVVGGHPHRFNSNVCTLLIQGPQKNYKLHKGRRCPALLILGVSALILSFAMNKPARHIGQES
jgi:hypothetical protein